MTNTTQKGSRSRNRQSLISGMSGLLTTDAINDAKSYFTRRHPKVISGLRKLVNFGTEN